MSPSDFSLVFLVHGRAERTIACLSTFLPALATRADLRELLILDNASSEPALLDWLATVPQRAPKARVIRSNKNLGVAGGRMLLYAEARGALVASLDDDLLLLDARFFDVMRDILADPGVGLAGVSGAWLDSWRRSRNSDLPSDSPFAGPVDVLAGCCHVFDRARLAAAGVALDARFSPFWAEDWDLCLQAQAAGLCIHRFPPAGLVHHEWGGSGAAWPSLHRRHWHLLVRKWAGRGVARFERERPWLRRLLACRYGLLRP